MGDIPIRRRFRMIIPAFPAFNIYTRIAMEHPLRLAQVVSRLAKRPASFRGMDCPSPMDYP
ncbi:MAG: hypothetical protein WCI03_07870 [bacterium]